MLKLYVWEDVLWDYTKGVMFALAETVEEARTLILASADYADVKRDLEQEPDDTRELMRGGGARGWASKHCPHPMTDEEFGSRAYKPPTTFAPGARVRYACEPPIFGTVLRTDGEGTYIEAPGYGELRCATRDLRVCGEGE